MSEAKTTADKSKGSTYQHQKRRHFGASLAAQQLIVRVPQPRVVQSSRVGKGNPINLYTFEASVCKLQNNKKKLARAPSSSEQADGSG